MRAGKEAGRRFEVVLFDLGGVLIELTGTARMVEWTSGTMTADQLLRRWLSSPAVRQFETGRSTPAEFAAAVIGEFNLPVGPEQFLKEFTSWTAKLCPGAIALLQNLSGSTILGSLPNTNELHWERLCRELRLPEYFQHNFPSHRTGFIKPDREAFQNVVDSLRCPAHRILFFDDNALNVAGAATAGMVAHKVCGVSETEEKLRQLGFLTQSEPGG
jgi:HAD superfamily hydrolase (TIGR01509 family)